MERNKNKSHRCHWS